MSKAPVPITFDEMIHEVQHEAYRIEDTQAALVASGLRSSPAPSQIRRAKVFHQIASGLIDLRSRQQQEHQGHRR